MLHNTFSYSNINAHNSVISEDGKIVSVSNPETHYIGIYFSKDPAPLNQYVDLSNPFNWVFYISIDDEDESQTNMPSGWDHLIEVFQKYPIPFVAIHKSEQPLVKTNESLRGRQIAVFNNIDDSDTLQSLCTEITRVLADAKISPSYRADNVSEIKGSNYLTYDQVVYKSPADDYDDTIERISAYVSASYDLPPHVNTNAAFNLFLAQKILMETMCLSHPISVSVMLNQDKEGQHLNFCGDSIGASQIAQLCDFNNAFFLKTSNTEVAAQQSDATSNLSRLFNSASINAQDESCTTPEIYALGR